MTTEGDRGVPPASGGDRPTLQRVGLQVGTVYIGKNGRLARSSERIDAALAIASAMRAWPNRKLPD